MMLLHFRYCGLPRGLLSFVQKGRLKDKRGIWVKAAPDGDSSSIFPEGLGEKQASPSPCDSVLFKALLL